MAAMVALRRGPRAAGRVRFLAAWGVAAALVLVPYFSVGGYRTASGAHRSYGASPGEHAPAVAGMTSSLGMPRKLAHYHLNMTGSTLARITGRPARELAPAAGLLLHAAFLGALGHALLRRREPRAWNRRLPWLVLGGTTLVACTAAGVSRVHSMPHFYALAPRYTGVTSYLLVSLVALAAVELEERRSRNAKGARGRALA